MPKLTIDNRSIEVPPGTKVIVAAEQLGIMIPRFCYHPALGSVGACRVCAVKVLEGRAKGIKMSCMLDAEDGMVVSTTDAEAVAFRRYVIEWLMLHHPHDCPVCDEGGHCLLQDTTIAGGHGLRRYRGPKRTHRDQFLGSLVQHEMNRCIQCYRCVRYYREYAGYDDLGVMGIGSRVYYGRFQEGPLQSPFAGNLIDVCPTGVYTDKPSRFKGRRWDFERTPSICIHCSLGCAITVDARYREVVRHEARLNPAVNGHFICDRGRYGYPYASAADRPWQAAVDGRRVDGAAALEAAGERLAAVAAQHGPRAVAVAGSVRCSLETMAALRRACRSQAWRGPYFFDETRQSQAVGTAVDHLLSGPAVSLPDVEASDLILLAGVDPVHEAPMLTLALRQAWRRGAAVVVVDPRPVALPFDFEHVPLAPDRIGPWLERLGGTVADGDTAAADIARRLRESARPAIIAGTGILPSAALARAAGLAASRGGTGPGAGLFFVLPGPNAFGAALLDETREGLDRVVAAIEGGSVKALILTESDLAWRFPDRKRLERALARLELLVVLDYTAASLAEAAHVFIPTATLYESGGVFINAEGRAQQAPAAVRGGRPIAQTGEGGHPPRVFGSDIPGGGQSAAWAAVRALAAAASGASTDEPTAPLVNLGELHPALAAVSSRPLPPEGLCITHKGTHHPPAAPEADAAAPAADEAGLELVWTDRIFGSEILSSQAPALRDLQEAPFLCMGKEAAAAWQLNDGAAVAIGPADRPWELTVRVVADMAPGIVVLPRLPGWQRLGLKGNYLQQGDIHQRS
jgi:NADH-quinone oxidoreductase subunit G